MVAVLPPGVASSTAPAADERGEEAGGRDAVLERLLQRRDEYRRQIAALEMEERHADDAPAAEEAAELRRSVWESEFNADEAGRRRFHRLTGFSATWFNDLWMDVKDELAEKGQARGKQPAVCNKDAVLAIVIMYTAADTPSMLAPIFHQNHEKLLSAITRIRPLLNAALVKRHVRFVGAMRPPLPDQQAGVPDDLDDIALAVDATPFEVHRPNCRFEEAKICYDVHHQMYALKKEVAVQANGRHYAVFWGRGFVGKTHDMKEHYDRAKDYTKYLTLLPEETEYFPDNTTGYWSIALDSGYIGTVDVPYQRRVIPKPSTVLGHSQRQRIQRLKKKRVVVEQFFGRMKETMHFTAHCYPFDHAHFDMDIDNCSNCAMPTPTTTPFTRT